MLFIEFVDEASASQALTLDGKMIDDKEVLVLPKGLAESIFNFEKRENSNPQQQRQFHHPPTDQKVGTREIMKKNRMRFNNNNNNTEDSKPKNPNNKRDPRGQVTEKIPKPTKFKKGLVDKSKTPNHIIFDDDELDQQTTQTSTKIKEEILDNELDQQTTSTSIKTKVKISSTTVNQSKSQNQHIFFDDVDEKDLQIPIMKQDPTNASIFSSSDKLPEHNFILKVEESVQQPKFGNINTTEDSKQEPKRPVVKFSEEDELQQLQSIIQRADEGYIQTSEAKHILFESSSDEE